VHSTRDGLGTGRHDSCATLDPPIVDVSYRADIDGLRGVAVLAVILFHVHAGWIPGGFAGVDVFFAISGFLLTRNILSELDDGSFGVGAFYRRRVKRIALPMLVVVGAVVAAAQLLLLPKDALRTASAGLWSIVSLGNVWFRRNLDTGYFSREAHEAPLLHLWSLGVEEQFYLVWPLVLPAAARLLGTSLGLFAAIATLAIASFAGGQALLGSDPRFAFYMLPTRAGGLLLGALAAIAAKSWLVGASQGTRSAELTGASGLGKPSVGTTGASSFRAMGPCLAGIFGALLVLGSFTRLTEDSPFPGWRAAIPSLGAALLLLSGETGTSRVHKLLSWQPLVAVGLVSYSAYLWHWPLLAFHRYAWGEVGGVARVVIALLTALLAWASWSSIERPARRSSARLARIVLLQWALPSLGVAGLALLAMLTGGEGLRRFSPDRASALARFWDESAIAVWQGVACDRKVLTKDDFSNPHCLIGPADAPAGTLVWGDSNAAHYVGMLEVFARAGGFRFRNLDAWACAPVGGNPSRFIPTDRIEDCIASNRLVLGRLRDFPVVVIAAAWPAYGLRPAFVEESLRLVRKLVSEGHSVVLLGKAPKMTGWDHSCREKALSIPWLRCPTELFRPLDARIAQANARLRRFARETPGVSYFDANDLLCAAPRGCTGFGDDGKPLYFDDSHLTLAGSRWLGERVLRGHGLPAAFAGIVSKLRAAERGRGEGGDVAAGPAAVHH